MTKFIVGLIVVALVVVAVIAAPLAWIWSVNTLFALTVPYTLKTWFAALILGGALFVSRNSSKS